MYNYFTPNTIIEVICLTIAVISLLKDSSWVWRSMILYLLITCLTEIGGIYVSRQAHNNHWVYNIFILFEAGFTHLMFAHLFNKYINSKPIIICGLALFCLFYVYEIESHGFFRYNHLTYAILSAQFVLYSLYYYYLLIQDHGYVNLKQSSDFWWVAGILFFYFSSTACNFFDDKLYSVMITPKHHLSYFIFKGLNIILYSCWSYSFICRKWPITKSEI
ncbi:MAG: hypothetical protein JWQ84_2277 [Mucilaginibacter sp.]|nr:hypothetical protein [Mucilaginibacter sp.]